MESQRLGFSAFVRGVGGTFEGPGVKPLFALNPHCARPAALIRMASLDQKRHGDKLPLNPAKSDLSIMRRRVGAVSKFQVQAVLPSRGRIAIERVYLVLA